MSPTRSDTSRFVPCSLLRERPLWILIALVLAFFARPMFFHQTFFFRDLYLLAFPQRMRLIELVRTAGLPLWDTYLHGGQPFLAEPTNMALYPTALLYFLLPAVTAFNVEIVLHFVLGAAAAYALARVLGISARASLIAGAVFTFCGFTLSAANLLNRLLAMPAGAFLLLFWHLFFLDRKAKWFLAAAAAGVLQVLAGSIEFLLLTLTIALGWSLCYPYSTPGVSLLRRAAIWAGLALAVLGISAIQVLPALEVIGQSSRGPGLSYEATSTWSLNPRRLPELVVPGYFGPTETLNERDYWGRRLEDEGYPLIVSVYFGFSALLLALSEGLARNGPGPPRRLRRFLLAVAGAAILLALGRFLFLSAFVHRTLPLAGVFRYPIKALAAAALPIALLAAAAADRRCGGGASQAGGRTVGVWLGSAAGLCAALALLLSASGPAANALTRVLFLESLSIQEHHRLAARLLHAALAGASSALLWLLARSGPRALAALSGILILDLGVAGYSLNPFAPREFLSREPAAARAVRPELHGGRLFRDASPAQISLTAPTDEISRLALFRRETLDFYTASAFGIPVIYHPDYDGLAPRRLLRLTSLIPRLPWDQRLPILSAGAVTLIVTAERPASPELQLIGEIPNSSNTPLFVYRNLAAATRVSFVSTAVAVRSETEALRGILSRGFDPRRHVVLEGDARAVSGDCPAARLTEIDRSPNAETIRVAAACDGYLVFSEALSPGWNAFVDGAPEPILRANLAFSAVRVPAGTHVVARVYRPVSVLIGAGVSLTSVALAMVLARVTSRDRRDATPPPPAASPME
jgi:hypothetical protein